MKTPGCTQENKCGATASLTKAMTHQVWDAKMSKAEEILDRIKPSALSEIH